MAFDWLFGPRQENGGTTFLIRSYVLDIEVAADVIRLLESDREYLTEQGVPELQISTGPARAEIAPPANEWHPGWSNQVVDIERLNEVSAYERDRLMVYGYDVTVDFRRHSVPSINGSDPSQVQKIARMLESNGTPRVQWKRLARLAPLVGFVALLVAEIWYALTEKLAASLIAIGVALSLLVGVLAVIAYVVLKRHFGNTHPGHRFRKASRAQVRDRIANSRATAVVSIVTIPIGAALGYLARIWFPVG